MKSGDIWKAYRHELPNGNNTHKVCEVLQFNASSDTPIGLPARAWSELGRIHCHARSNVPPPIGPLQWEDQLTSDTEFQWLHQDLHYLCPISSLMELLETDELIGVTDGSFLQPMGTAAFCLATRAGDIKLIGRLQVPGENNTMDAY